MRSSVIVKYNTMALEVKPFLTDCLERSSLQLLDREGAGPGRERHISKGRVLAGGRRHARAVGHEDVARLVALVEAVQERGLRVATHPGRAHLVDDLARHGFPLEAL